MASKYAIETVFNLIDKVSKPLGEIDNSSRAISRSMKNSFSAMQTSIEGVGRKLGGLAKDIVKTQVMLYPQKFVAWATAGVKGATEFADTMAKMSTSVDTTKYSMKELEKQIMAVANAEGEDVTALAKIQMDAIGTGGIDPGKSAEFAMTLKKIADVAGTDTHTAMGDLTSVMSAFGKSEDEASKIAGQMLLVTQKLGKNITFETIAKGMKSVMPQMAALNISTGEMFSSFATLTSMGENSTKAMAGMGTMIEKVMRPSKAASELAKNLGIEFNAAALKSKGLAGFIADVTEKTGGNTEILTRLFENVDIARMMRKLGVEGAEAFTSGLAQMDNGAAALTEMHDKSQDSLSERWEDAMNRISNAGIKLGAALLPALDKVVAKINDLAVWAGNVDFSGVGAAISGVVTAVGWVIGALIEAIKIAWQFRGVIAAIAVIAGIAGAVLLGLAAKQKIVTAVTFFTTLATKGQAAALGLLTAGSKAHILTTIAFTAATKIAAAGQWLLNAAMTANPIGLVIAAVVALIAILILLVKNWDKVSAAIKNNQEKVMGIIAIFTGPFGFIISMIKELIQNWDRVTAAFKDGGILAGIKKIGAVLLSGLLAPIQGLLELISHIPGLGHLAGAGANKIAELRNNLLGEDANITAKIKMPKSIEAETKSADSVSASIPGLKTPGFDTPDFSTPDFTSAAGGTADGKSKLHGVVDISGGAASIAAGGLSKTGTGGAASNTPQLSESAALMSILNVVKHIDSGVFEIVRISTQTISAMPNIGGSDDDVVELGARDMAPVTQAERMAYSLQERRETVVIEVAAAHGTDARIVKAPRDIDIQLVSSGANV